MLKHNNLFKICYNILNVDHIDRDDLVMYKRLLLIYLIFSIFKYNFHFHEVAFTKPKANFFLFCNLFVYYALRKTYSNIDL